ncbi:opine dehydrogenase-like [Clytia hemisphaerica]|uniref:Uncharacterized protein n=1 Tax=Clytia hemisphaerica TaxID=252671 RepID=A0A7M5V944_9CNID
MSTHATNRISILGAGAGGCALAYHLIKTGYEVLLYQDKDHLIKAVESYDGFKSALHGKCKITCFTTSIKQAVQFSEVLILVVPAYGQVNIFQAALPYLTPNHIFLSLPGNFAIFDYLKSIRESNVKIDFPVSHIAGTPIPCTFVESSIIPYACRRVQKNGIFIGAIKQFISVGAYPKSKAESTYERLDAIFESIDVRLEKTNLLATTFYNSNLILHPTIVMYNAGHIKCQNKGFRFYKDGVSPLVCKIFESLDKEMLLLGHSCGFHLESFASYYRRYYGDKNPNNTLSAFFQNAHFLHFVKAPNDLNGRFISEDLQFVLLPLIRYLANRNQVPTPLAESLIVSLQCMLGHNIHPLRELPEDEWAIVAAS